MVVSLLNCVLFFHLQAPAQVPKKLMLRQSNEIECGLLYGADSVMPQTDLDPDPDEVTVGEG